MSQRNNCAHQCEDDRKCHDLFLFPPHSSSDAPCTSSEDRRLTCHDVRLVNQKFDAFPSTQNLLHILDHDIFDRIEFCLGLCERVGGWRCVIGVQQGGNNSLQISCIGTGRFRGGRGRKGGELCICEQIEQCPIIFFLPFFEDQKEKRTASSWVF